MGETLRRWRTSQSMVSLEAKMTRKKSGEGVPALQNEGVTGMTEEKQDEVIRESGRAPRRRAAEEFYDANAPGWTRTTDPQLRRLLLYPAELRARDSVRT